VTFRAGGRSCVALMDYLYLLLRAAMRITTNLVAGNNGDLESYHLEAGSLK